MDAPRPRRLLVIDDEEMVRSMLADVLLTFGYEVEPADCGQSALAQFRAGRYQVVITDLRMPGMNGLEVTERLRQIDPGLPVILLTAGAAEVEDERRANVLVVRKPVSLVGLGEAIDMACRAA